MDYQNYFERARKATRYISAMTSETTNEVLRDLADFLIQDTNYILDENKKDLEKLSTTDPRYDRLMLTATRIADIAGDILNVAAMNSPLGEVISDDARANGLKIKKIRVPLGVVGIIYEARPNVTLDVFSLCFKTGNVCLLKGGSDAAFSNTAIINIIHRVLKKNSINTDVAMLLPAERKATDELLSAVGYVDVLIPRGSQQLINHVRAHSKVPVIETGAGIVHTYFDATGNLEKGKAIITNAKTRRVSVCNALDCLLIHQSRLPDLKKIVAPMAEKKVEIYADASSYAALKNAYPEALLHKAEPEHFGTEFLSLKMAVKTVQSLTEALDHIATYSSKHSEAIISEDPGNTQRFLQQVDAAAVYANASTAFTDGAQFGLGAEIGISTQKLHARGPMGLQELTSYKWIVEGDGHIRS